MDRLAFKLANFEEQLANLRLDMAALRLENRRKETTQDDSATSTSTTNRTTKSTTTATSTSDTKASTVIITNKATASSTCPHANTTTNNPYALKHFILQAMPQKKYADTRTACQFELGQLVILHSKGQTEARAWCVRETPEFIKAVTEEDFANHLASAGKAAVKPIKQKKSRVRAAAALPPASP